MLDDEEMMPMRRGTTGMEVDRETEREMEMEVVPIHQAQCSMEIEGKDMIIGFLLATRQITPDSVFRIEQTQIKTHSDRVSCELVCRVTIEGMMLYDLPIEQVIEKVVVVCQQHRNKGGEKGESVSATASTHNKRAKKEEEKSENSSYLKEAFDPCKVYTDHRGMYPAALPKPTRLALSGDLTLFIDEHKRIDKIQFVQSASQV
jgi:hypothetical protein